VASIRDHEAYLALAVVLPCADLTRATNYINRVLTLSRDCWKSVLRSGAEAIIEAAPSIARDLEPFHDV
jgi:hypothetical protein